ncbi:hypothetical protein COCSUDRAFT_65392 [Coccomyxa subellipsoidea C-169]|uniref:Uncharacterized protein n=1 Tax=Coccomyxa subellipsoidea (strain C-169) TaxID=574566 RepID=I0Z1I1_COCSC|nr:hypothetical protein COCSUDRAFT_65392 [Coccomyxa subellipsoidea C-169]EIE24500.1 hypothetical protein COCSUDRAFT_65392 [Coccomyxa subellipsoidea C-169]|eukprot:XP_005649044.1 hypothetical protein COCSUDRAFT_65392 [Coccomyxa subellipsoidea C-169]
MAQQRIDRLWSEVQRTEQKIEEQQEKIEKAIEDEKPQKLVDSYMEEKARLVAKEKDLSQQLMALQTQLITPAGMRAVEYQASNGIDHRPLGRRSVATDATKPDSNFYVESAMVDSLADDMATGLVVLYRDPRQSGKTTDALAVCRRLRQSGIQVAYVDLGDAAGSAFDEAATNAEPIWREVLEEFDIAGVPGKSSYRTFRSFLKRPEGPRVAVVFDECDTLHQLPVVFKRWLMGVRLLSQQRFPDSRLCGQMLVGTPRMEEAIPNSLDGIAWSKLIVGAVQSPSRFSPTEVGELLCQMVAARNRRLSDSIEDWASSLWSHTEGSKGLTGICLRELDIECFSTLSECKLSAWEKSLRHDLVKRLTRGTRTAYDRMLSAVDTSDPTMQAIIENLLLTGRHAVPDPDSLCNAEYELLCDGVVRVAGVAGGHYLEASSPMLAAAMLNAALDSIQDLPQLPAPPAEPTARELGEYLLENGLGQFQSSRLLQEKVRTSDGQQVLEWALQHELSRGLHFALRSAVLFTTLEFKDLKLAVEVRNTAYQAPGASGGGGGGGGSSRSRSIIDSAPAESQTSMGAGTAESARRTGPPSVSQGSSASQYAGATEADRCRRLDLYVGNGQYSTGYELSSAASAADLKDHVQRSVKYSEQHNCQVFAVNLQRPKRPRGRPRKKALPPSEALTQAQLKDAMGNFASWPKEHCDKVVFVNVLLELELGRVLLQYVDEPDVVKVIQLSEPQGQVRETALRLSTKHWLRAFAKEARELGGLGEELNASGFMASFMEWRYMQQDKRLHIQRIDELNLLPA